MILLILVLGIVAVYVMLMVIIMGIGVTYVIEGVKKLIRRGRGHGNV